MSIIVLPNYRKRKERVPDEVRMREQGLISDPTKHGILRIFFCHAHKGWAEERVPEGRNVPLCCNACVEMAEGMALAAEQEGIPLGNMPPGWDTVRRGTDIRGGPNRPPEGGMKTRLHNPAVRIVDMRTEGGV